MKLIDEIVALLSESKGSLTDALLKTKVLMHRIGYRELAGWVNDELIGYPPDQKVPPYRVMPARLVGHVSNLAYSHNNMTLPILHLPEKVRVQWEQNEMRGSISVLEQLAIKPDQHLMVPIGPEFHHLIDKVLQGYNVERMWLQMEATQVVHALTEIRARLLDFVLNLQGELGDVKEDEVKEAAKSIDAPAMFNGAVFGDNTTFVIGNGNTTNVSNVKNGDFESLAAALKGAGVSQLDIQELESAIAADEGKVIAETKSFGPAVRGWMTKMLGKVVDTAWVIELNVAGGLLTNALQAYYF
ncbi:hypothetical protein N5J06_01925 [Ralstonia sp. CHL-2022]|uniref:AbiTii domain-containing protein n=1 Tax=Ralstonia mojiangensis TaxID=2953895 RepID=A0ABT2L384_9RALS|nr:hypothetical protein [Ralstonia mojiangensis]MCT7309689.1 hypothetical protein [Ralstonia mojiangensis]